MLYAKFEIAQVILACISDIYPRNTSTPTYRDCFQWTYELIKICILKCTLDKRHLCSCFCMKIELFPSS